MPGGRVATTLAKILCTLLLFTLFPAAAKDAPWRQDSLVVHIHSTDQRIIGRVFELVDDIWHVDAHGVTCLARPDELEALIEDGILYQVIAPSLDAFRIKIFGSLEAARANQLAYQSYPQMVANLEALIGARPDIAKRIVIGTSVQGREIVGVRISAAPERINLYRPGIMLVGAHHAREWIAMEVPYLIAKHLLEQHGVDAALTAAINTREITIVPCLNPDGLEHSRSSDRYWRKNMRDNNGNGIFGEYGDGVDLNRNYRHGFGGIGSSGLTTSETYRGPAPLSEPETQALDALFKQRPYDISISYHSYGQLILYPWGNTHTDAPDVALLHALAEAMANTMFSVYNVQYVPQRGSYLYFASGVCEDHLYAFHDVAAFNVELRPKGFPPGFELPAAQILPTFEENMPAMAYALSLEADVAVRDAYATSTSPLIVVATLINHGNAPVQALTRLYHDAITSQQRLAEAAPAALSPGATAQLRFEVSRSVAPQDTLSVTVASRLLTDATPENNQYHFLANNSPAPVLPRAAAKAAVIGRRLHGEPALDGRLDDWPPVYRVLEMTHNYDAAHVRGAPSARLTLYAAWTDQALFLAGEVYDDGLRTADAAQPLDADAIIIRLDRANSGGWYQPAHFSLLLGGLAGAPYARARRGEGTDEWNGRGIGWPAGSIAASAGAPRFVLECSTPWEDLGGSPTPGDVWGFDVSYLDYDTGAAGEMQWAGQGDRAASWGTLLFAAVPNGPDDWDRDGVVNPLEAFFPALEQTNLLLPDSDGDALPDGTEDFNRNAARDGGETSPRRRDTDGDQFTDGLETLLLRSDPLDRHSPVMAFADSDADELPNDYDFAPQQADADGDRFKDGFEVVTHGYESMFDPDLRPRLGDINADGAVTNLDALMAQSLFLGLLAPNHTTGAFHADPGRDGFITNVDSLLLQSFFLGNLAWLPL